jgi:hypothetical protein
MENDEILERLEADTLRMMVKDLQNALSNLERNKVFVEYGKGTSDYGPGVNVKLTADQVATAISAYLITRDVHIVGPRTIRIDSDMDCNIYVDPSGRVIADGMELSGRGA